MKRHQGLLIVLGIMFAGVLAAVIGVWLYLPGYIEERVVAEAKARGIERNARRDWIRLEARAVVGRERQADRRALVRGQARLGRRAAPRLRADARVQVSATSQVGVSGSLPRVLLELSRRVEAKNQSATRFEAPLVAEPRDSPARGRSARRGAVARALGRCHDPHRRGRGVLGAELQAFRVRAGQGRRGLHHHRRRHVSIGFGDQHAQAAPLRLDASVDARRARAS